MTVETTTLASTTVRGVSGRSHSCTLLHEVLSSHSIRGRDMPIEIEELAVFLPHRERYQKSREVIFRALLEEESSCR
jgi:hypothetical protein